MPPTLRVVISASSALPGVESLLHAALIEAREGVAVSVLFSEGGLDALTGSWPERLHAAGVRTSLCARSARARRLDPATLPPTVVWSSLTNAVADAGLVASGPSPSARPGTRLWTVFA